MAICEIAKNGIWSKKLFCEFDLFDLTSFFGWTFLNFLAHSVRVGKRIRNSEFAFWAQSNVDGQAKQKEYNIRRIDQQIELIY